MREYELIKEFYGDRKADRSDVPLINHINEGLVVLKAINASDAAKAAYCLHPMLQPDEDLAANFKVVSEFCPAYIVGLAMEYRSIANAFLSNKVDRETIKYVVDTSPLKEVNDMLIADKVQNQKDFLTYHQATHERSKELTKYFNIWLSILGVDSNMTTYLNQKIDAYKESIRERAL